MTVDPFSFAQRLRAYCVHDLLPNVFFYSSTLPGVSRSRIFFLKVNVRAPVVGLRDRR